MSIQESGTTPKPFVFVLMPFSDSFDDIYTFGIRGAASDVGAYAERIDSQIFTEGILERIFNQISKADVIVADMTGRNPNVFYEVGYAHALGKIVLLLTQSADDIPFDLKHRPHLIYAGSIDRLRTQLGERMNWAIAESKLSGKNGLTEKLSIYLEGQPLPEAESGERVPSIGIDNTYGDFALSLEVRNDSPQIFAGSSHLYVVSERYPLAVPCKISVPKTQGEKDSLLDGEAIARGDFSALRPIPLAAAEIGHGLASQFKLPAVILRLPPRAVDQIEIPFKRSWDIRSGNRSLFRLRIHSETSHYDFDFCLEVQEAEELSPNTDEREIVITPDEDGSQLPEDH